MERFQYIYNEIPLYIVYESDFAFIEKKIKQVTTEELCTKKQERIEELKVLVKESPIDDIEIRVYP